MANALLPIEERDLTPEEVELLDKRRRRGQLFLVICFQCIIVGTLLTIWSGQDLTYSPGWIHPMFYWNFILGIAALYFGIAGIRLRRGSNEFISY
jgi:peptidoglycan/LPS O-acetylase OafA/YrhL